MAGHWKGVGDHELGIKDGFAARNHLVGRAAFAIAVCGGELCGDFGVNADQRRIGGKAPGVPRVKFTARLESSLQRPEGGGDLLNTGQQLAVVYFRITKKAVGLFPASVLGGYQLGQFSFSKAVIIPSRDPTDRLDGTAELGRENGPRNQCGAIS